MALNMTYIPAKNRYEEMAYRRCGASGLKLPAISGKYQKK